MPARPGQNDGPPAPLAPIRSEPGTTGKVRSLDHAGSAEKRGDDSSKPKRREPRINVKMARLPDAPVAAPARTVRGEKAQKPDIKLSKDVIAGHKQGMTVPLEQLKAEETDKKKRVGKRGGLSGFTGEKPRRDGEKEGFESEDKPRRKNLAGMASARAERQRGNRRQAASLERSSYPSRDSGRKTLKRRKGTNTAAPRKDAVVLELPCSIRSFCASASVPFGQVLRVLMGMGR